MEERLILNKKAVTHTIVLCALDIDDIAMGNSPIDAFYDIIQREANIPLKDLHPSDVIVSEGTLDVLMKVWASWYQSTNKHASKALVECVKNWVNLDIGPSIADGIDDNTIYLTIKGVK